MGTPFMTPPSSFGNEASDSTNPTEASQLALQIIMKDAEKTCLPRRVVQSIVKTYDNFFGRKQSLGERLRVCEITRQSNHIFR